MYTLFNPELTCQWRHLVNYIGVLMMSTVSLSGSQHIYFATNQVPQKCDVTKWCWCLPVGGSSVPRGRTVCTDWRSGHCSRPLTSLPTSHQNGDASDHARDDRILWYVQQTKPASRHLSWKGTEDTLLIWYLVIKCNMTWLTVYAIICFPSDSKLFH